MFLSLFTKENILNELSHQKTFTLIPCKQAFVLVMRKLESLCKDIGIL